MRTAGGEFMSKNINPPPTLCPIPPDAVWLTAEQLAASLQLSLRTVKRRLQDGTIPSRLFGRRRRIHRSYLDQ